MASVVTRPGGNFWIQVKIGDNRKTIRLGRVPRRAAEEICRRVETLNACRLGGVSLDEATAAWVGKLGPDLSSRLAACGLIEARQAHTMSEFLEYVWSQLDVKESTIQSYEHVRRNLLAFFGPDKSISSINAEDADEFCRYLAGLGLSKATIAGRSRRARQFFTVAAKKKWIPGNPFEDIRPGSQTNPERQQYVPMEHVLAVIEEMPNDEYKAILAMARIAGMRVPSEPLSLSEPLREDGDAELGDVVEDRSAESPFEVAATALLPDEIARLLAPLDEREREILKLRFGLDRGEPRTLEEVGEHFNLTRERIRQIEARAMSKLRHPSSDTGARDLLAV